uniref:NADH-ubiquinone oxidoreductase chain 5 n=1 Tax=Stimulopalpus japonicus TaxID=209965 RepID=A0A343QCJ4_9NEOP|nr:NADH dehydrogenase subunit 5 [Stimulopalpus japonicus]ATU07141.1 NADH dehydrogenase subunit 5 [Stimulopalpus japonicus]
MFMNIRVCLVMVFTLFIMFMFSFFIFIYLVKVNQVLFFEWEILEINGLSISMSILLDWMSCSFMMFVFFISCMVVNYSSSYMYGDYSIVRFIILVFFFVLSMMFLIISPNLISLLLGWDGLGLVSYVLVIYYQNKKSSNAGMLTALSNRIGDVMLLVSIGWMINFGGWNFIYNFDYVCEDMIILSWLIVLASMTKSAQIPFSAWLPAAMAAPTPVSSLVHSSTLVTAGVYLLIRFSESIFYNSNLVSFVLLISSSTMLMAGIGAVFEYDLKKIIALSTLSQLGLMISTMSIGLIDLSFFHLLTHALFKALLFMCAGYMIHVLNECQDIRYMGSISTQVPILGMCFSVSNLSLCGMPFLAGFYSKDLILEMVSMGVINKLIYYMFYISTLFTVIYTFRLIYYVMINKFNLCGFHILGDNDYTMLSSMMMMLLMVVFGGSFLMWMIFVVPYLIILPFILKVLTLMVVLVGSLIGFVYAMNVSYLNLIFNYKLKLILGSMWFLPYLSELLKYSFVYVGELYYKNFDLGWLEKIGGSELNKKLYSISMLNQVIQNNNIKIYFLLFMYFYFWLFIFILF